MIGKSRRGRHGITAVNMWKIRVLGAVFVLAAVLVLLSACGRLWFIWLLRRRGVCATGTVVAHVSDDSSRKPVIRFPDQLGHPRSFSPNVVSSWKRDHGALPAGTKVEVAYLPEDPDRVRLLSDTAELGADKSLHGRATRFFHLTVMSPSFPGVSLKRRESRLRRKLRHRGVRTVGTVVAEKPSDSESNFGGPHFDPKIQFADQQGDTVTFVHRSVRAAVGGKQYGLPAIGEHVQIVYLPGSPQVARMTGAARTIGDLAGRLVLTLMALGIGLFFLLIPKEVLMQGG